MWAQIQEQTGCAPPSPFFRLGGFGSRPSRHGLQRSVKAGSPLGCLDLTAKAVADSVTPKPQPKKWIAGTNCLTSLSPYYPGHRCATIWRTKLQRHLPEYVYNVQRLVSRGWSGFRYRFLSFCHEFLISNKYFSSEKDSQTLRCWTKMRPRNS